MDDICKILILGDFHPSSRIVDLVDKGNGDAIFPVEWDAILQRSDLNVINLESPVISGNISPLEKIGPNLCCSEKTVQLLRSKGFSLLTLANNHFFDYGDKGVTETLAACRAAGMDHVGGGVNLEEAVKPYRVTLRGRKISIINICENEFSIATSSSGGSAPLDLIDNYHAIVEEKKFSDHVLIIFHGGLEHHRLPSPQMKKICHFFADAGADAVVCHHIHCFSGYEIYNSVPIFYGIGNCSFDLMQKPEDPAVYGFGVELSFSAAGTDFVLYPFMQGCEFPGVKLLSDEQKDHFEQEIGSLNRTLLDDAAVEKTYHDFVSDNKLIWLNYFEPFTDRISNRLRRYGLMLSFVSRLKYNYFYNIIRCETHREALLYLLKKNYEKKKE